MLVRSERAMISYAGVLSRHSFPGEEDEEEGNIHVDEPKR